MFLLSGHIFGGRSIPGIKSLWDLLFGGLLPQILNHVRLINLFAHRILHGARILFLSFFHQRWDIRFSILPFLSIIQMTDSHGASPLMVFTRYPKDTIFFLLLKKLLPQISPLAHQSIGTSYGSYPFPPSLYYSFGGCFMKLYHLQLSFRNITWMSGSLVFSVKEMMSPYTTCLWTVISLELCGLDLHFLYFALEVPMISSLGYAHSLISFKKMIPIPHKHVNCLSFCSTTSGLQGIKFFIIMAIPLLLRLFRRARIQSQIFVMPN